MFRPEMLPSSADLGARIERAEQAVQVADARVLAAHNSLRENWKSRAPGVAVAILGTLLAGSLLRPRSAHRAGGSASSAWRLVLPLLGLVEAPIRAAAATLIAGLAARKTHAELPTAPSIDLEKYAGLWHEIARLPMKFEKPGDRDITAHYQLFDDGVRITNRCVREGRLVEAIGKARAEPANSAKLEVSFAPSILNALPFVWADYWILSVANDYSVAMVGTPDRACLWLLARQPFVSHSVMDAFLTRANALGFDVDRLIYAEHSSAPRRTGADELSTIAEPPPVAVG
ncbi:MAG: lipocalin family protein [Burkholderiaceae bacterium]